ncbi:SCY1-like protein 2 [Trichonephila clavipes]|uniref:SCY1-like protein 2 n=1 Tax=Trichonephila clavipes TaxID=2585209 RepID=A0A8X6VFC6_TRICX|nr:SCY1-like protein 2 [Trichonephila clavipes]
MSPSPIVTTPNVGMDFLSSGRSNMRRYSAAALYASSGVPATCNSRGPSPAGSASSLLQQIGSGVVRNYFVCLIRGIKCYWMNSFSFMFIEKFISPKSCNTFLQENIVAVVALWSSFSKVNCAQTLTNIFVYDSLSWSSDLKVVSGWQKISSSGRPLSNDRFPDPMHPLAPEEIEAQGRGDK